MDKGEKESFFEGVTDTEKETGNVTTFWPRVKVIRAALCACRDEERKSCLSD